ncbi:hypothetical protein M634_11080 [Vibrio parahaemolyticus O1:Kuk str. FDA_R31]|uniref:S1 family peptidase n=1 Tax=Vibrio parahaemolyticus TaxID=670 RepID=UPI0003590A1A|nr:serine protease [Vibrio parahaemolyticus]AGQ92284.1 hypothetical protein M634_11080 [Vibrio parahaemolyticus O1:Kuk str. FDA_R31]EJB5289978.1 trypsin-like peptidase domain-containing protein [Vibrio parahaemolyticus]EJG2016832.1 trypsin-like peptidase domain-containing protein [Vibrio parahaemolyticus]EJG2030596.1 trypsin-like peptidase domain-containing protein [Vibrio parahaemolyticus]ODW65062.1 hypothetical protein BBL89_14795 [Vibrio parahaemolyticus]
MKKLDLHDVVFPVMTLSDSASQLWGTAFSIGGGYYMTAKHVVESAILNFKDGNIDYVAIGKPDEEKQWCFTSFSEDDIEHHPKLDIAIFKLPEDFNGVTPLTWSLDGLDIFDDILSAGYPYSLDVVNKVINVRGIKGHIIGTGRHILNGEDYQSYELSFNPPRGLSGCPVISSSNGNIYGVLVGNKSHEMEVASSEEYVVSRQQTELYAKYEMMHIGISIQSIEFLGYRFDLIEDTLLNHLHKYSLIK